MTVDWQREEKLWCDGGFKKRSQGCGWDLAFMRTERQQYKDRYCHSDAPVASKSVNDMSSMRWYPRASAAVVVIAVHVLLLCSLGNSGSQPRQWRISTSGDSFIIAEIMRYVPRTGEVASQKEPRMLPIAIDAPRPDLDEGSLISTAAPAVSPRLSPSQSADVGEYAKRAGVPPGEPLIVVLSVLVDTEGKPGAITVLRGCGSTAADKAAIDYAHLLRWIPGTINGAPRSMLVILPVTLDSSRHPAASFQRQAEKLNTLSARPMLSVDRGCWLSSWNG